MEEVNEARRTWHDGTREETETLETPLPATGTNTFVYFISFAGRLTVPRVVNVPGKCL